MIAVPVPVRLSELKYEFIRTPLERPLQRLRWALGALRRGRHPELREIYLEDERLRATLARVLEPGSNGIDVGCHYGSILSEFCRLAPRGRHVAFEVVPAKVRFLRRKFPDLEVFELGLFDHAGTASFFVCRRATALSSLAQQSQAGSERIQVTLARLDDVLPADRPYQLLKLDVEGAELPVLRGARATLARHRPRVLFECGPGGPQGLRLRSRRPARLLRHVRPGLRRLLPEGLPGGRRAGRAGGVRASHVQLPVQGLQLARGPAPAGELGRWGRRGVRGVSSRTAAARAPASPTSVQKT